MIGRKLSHACAAAGLALLAACATPQTEALRRAPGDLPRQAQITQVPFYPQERFYCGPAALAMALSWSGMPSDQDTIAAQIYTPGREGTLASDLLAGARRNGRLAVALDSLDRLLQEIAAGHPVVVFQNLGLSWIPVWHFAVATGYDLESEELLLHSGTTRDLRISFTTFERTWERAGRWALLVLPPGRLPAGADEPTLLRAAFGLEQAGRPREAAESYAVIAAKWPASVGAQVGLGNASLAAGDPARAELAFRRAVALDSALAPAWNNLAHALARQGKRTAAIEAALHAIAIGGSGLETYRTTLREVGGGA